MSSSVALKKPGMTSPPQGKQPNYHDLRELWKGNHMESFQDFFKCYNNKDVVLTFEALQKVMQFYHQKGIDMLNLGFTLPNLANRILHSSTSLKFFPFNQEDKNFDDYLRKWLTGGPSIIFTRYAKVGIWRVRKNSNMCKTIAAIDASQLYPFSMMKDMPTQVYTKWELLEDTGLFLCFFFLSSKEQEKVSGMHKIEVLSEAEPTMLYSDSVQSKITKTNRCIFS